MTTMLLQGGTVLVHRAGDEVEAVRADVLVRDGKIDKVEAGIKLDGPHEVLDCTHKLIAPGFVDTHHHLWQTQLKGIHADQSLLEYMPCGNMGASVYTPDDVFYGELAGALEALDGGITTVLDYSHVNYSPEHVFAAIQGSQASGVRSVYGYTPSSRVKGLVQGNVEMLDFLEPWVMETFNKLAKTPLGPRMELGFAFDGFFLPPQMLKSIFDQVYAAPTLRVFSAHDNSTSMWHNKPSNYGYMKQHDLLDPKGKTYTVLVHSTSLMKHPAADLQRDKIFVSITPASELSMGMGTPVPVALNREHDAHASQFSIGVDCQSISEAFIPGQLRSQLYAVRQYTHAKADAEDKWYASMDRKYGHFPGVLDAFNLATLGGARALGMENEVGRIMPGYNADLVVWDTRSPSMLAVAEENPVAAIILHSQEGDVFGVLVDGIVRKWGGKLKPTEVDAPQGLVAGYKPPVQGKLTWDQLVDHILESRKRLMALLNKVDMAKTSEGFVVGAHLNQSGLIDPVENKKYARISGHRYNSLQ